MTFICNPGINYDDYCKNTPMANCSSSCANPVIYDCNCDCNNPNEYPECNNILKMQFIGYIAGAIILIIIIGICVTNIKRINRENNIFRRNGRLEINFARNCPLINRTDNIPPSYESLPPAYQDIEESTNKNN